MTSRWTKLSEHSWDAVADDADRMVNEHSAIMLDDADYYLTNADQFRRRHLVFAGTLTAPRTIYMLAGMHRRMSFENQTNQTLSVCYDGTSDRGSAVNIASGRAQEVQGDGWNVVSVPSDVEGLPQPTSGQFTLPAGQLTHQVDDPAIKATSSAIFYPADFRASLNGAYSTLADGSATFHISGRAIGFASLEMEERVINLPNSTPVKIVNYENTSSNTPITIDNPNGLWTPQTRGTYMLGIDISLLAPNNSAFTFYVARNEDLQDALTDSVSISGGSQNLVTSMDEVAADWPAGDSMSFWVERTSGAGDVTFYDITVSMIQREIFEPQPSEVDTSWSYFIWN